MDWGSFVAGASLPGRRDSADELPPVSRCPPEPEVGRRLAKLYGICP